MKMTDVTLHQPFTNRTFFCGHFTFLNQITTTLITSPIFFIYIFTSFTTIQSGNIFIKCDLMSKPNVSPKCFYESEYPSHPTSLVNSSKLPKQTVTTGSLFCPSTSN